MFPGSSVVEQPAVNRLVAGSNPARGANKTSHFRQRGKNENSSGLVRGRFQTARPAPSGYRFQMPIDDPKSWLEGASAIKATFDSVRTAIGLVRDAEAISGHNEQQKKAIDNALATASSTATIAEMEIAKPFGYQLCRCQFPPTAMLTVGYFNRNVEDVASPGDPVFECPKCGFTNAGPFTFKRTAPPR